MGRGYLMGNQVAKGIARPRKVHSKEKWLAS